MMTDVNCPQCDANQTIDVNEKPYYTKYECDKCECVYTMNKEGIVTELLGDYTEGGAPDIKKPLVFERGKGWQ